MFETTREYHDLSDAKKIADNLLETHALFNAQRDSYNVTILKAFLALHKKTDSKKSGKILEALSTRAGDREEEHYLGNFYQYLQEGSDLSLKQDVMRVLILLHQWQVDTRSDAEHFSLLRLQKTEVFSSIAEIIIPSDSTFMSESAVFILEYAQRHLHLPITVRAIAKLADTVLRSGTDALHAITPLFLPYIAPISEYMNKPGTTPETQADVTLFITACLLNPLLAEQVKICLIENKMIIPFLLCLTDGLDTVSKQRDTAARVILRELASSETDIVSSRMMVAASLEKEAAQRSALWTQDILNALLPKLMARIHDKTRRDNTRVDSIKIITELAKTPELKARILASFVEMGPLKETLSALLYTLDSEYSEHYLAAELKQAMLHLLFENLPVLSTEHSLSAALMLLPERENHDIRMIAARVWCTRLATGELIAEDQTAHTEEVISVTHSLDGFICDDSITPPHQVIVLKTYICILLANCLAQKKPWFSTRMDEIFLQLSKELITPAEEDEEQRRNKHFYTACVFALLTGIAHRPRSEAGTREALVYLYDVLTRPGLSQFFMRIILCSLITAYYADYISFEKQYLGGPISLLMVKKGLHRALSAPEETLSQKVAAMQMVMALAQLFIKEPTRGTIDLAVFRPLLARVMKEYQATTPATADGLAEKGYIAVQYGFFLHSTHQSPDPSSIESLFPGEQAGLEL